MNSEIQKLIGQSVDITLKGEGPTSTYRAVVGSVEKNIVHLDIPGRPKSCLLRTTTSELLKGECEHALFDIPGLKNPQK